MRVFIRKDYEELSKYTAQFIKTQILLFFSASNPNPRKTMNIAFPSGFSVQLAYKFLGEMVKNGEVSFKNVVAWHIDEYVGLSEDDDMVQKNWMYDNIWKNVDILPENVHYLDPWEPKGGSFNEECLAFEEAIKNAGGLDLSFFGTGADGHVGRNEPGSSLTSCSRLTSLAYDTRIQLSSRWSKPLESIPKTTLTMGINTIFNSKTLLILFTGVARARALEMCLEFPVNHMFPVSYFQKHGNCVFAADDPATMELRIKTVTYFRGIERTADEHFGGGDDERGIIGTMEMTDANT